MWTIRVKSLKGSDAWLGGKEVMGREVTGRGRHFL